MTFAITARNAALAALGTLLNGGTLRLKANGGAIIVNLPLGNPAFNAPSNGTMTCKPITSTAATLTGVVTTFDLLDNVGTVQVSGNVSMNAGSDLVIDNTNVAVLQVINASTLSITMN